MIDVFLIQDLLLQLLDHGARHPTLLGSIAGLPPAAGATPAGAAASLGPPGAAEASCPGP